MLKVGASSLRCANLKVRGKRSLRGNLLQIDTRHRCHHPYHHRIMIAITICHHIVIMTVIATAITSLIIVTIVIVVVLTIAIIIVTITAIIFLVNIVAIIAISMLSGSFFFFFGGGGFWALNYGCRDLRVQSAPG